MEELYFCLHLTGDEHDIVNYNLAQKCHELGLELKYYRKLKEGHRPMYREVKVVGEKLKINLLKKYMRESFLDEQVERNPWKVPR